MTQKEIRNQMTKQLIFRFASDFFYIYILNQPLNIWFVVVNHKKWKSMFNYMRKDQKN